METTAHHLLEPVSQNDLFFNDSRCPSRRLLGIIGASRFRGASPFHRPSHQVCRSQPLGSPSAHQQETEPLLPPNSELTSPHLFPSLSTSGIDFSPSSGAGDMETTVHDLLYNPACVYIFALMWRRRSYFHFFWKSVDKFPSSKLGVECL